MAGIIIGAIIAIIVGAVISAWQTDNTPWPHGGEEE